MWWQKLRFCMVLSKDQVIEKQVFVFWTFGFKPLFLGDSESMKVFDFLWV